MPSGLSRTLAAATDSPDIVPDDEDRTPLEFDDDPWDVFLSDDEPSDPLPDPGDFWVEREL
jgi:hypothetical protein